MHICTHLTDGKISLLSLISFHSLCSSMALSSPSKVLFHCSPAWDIVPHIMPVVIFAITTSYAA